ncbi:ATP-binding protein [Streptomyces sp. NPDC102384]|uniref:ATP-binding protein n=1 Tax=Streptomyces sp. NPDC102384 TaxID=3366166 RepID=UPI0038202B08
MPASQAQGAATVSAFVQGFSATRRGARLARRLATLQLDLWGVPCGGLDSDVVTLLVAELASNAALHGRVPGRDFELRLHYDVTTGVVRIEVSDTHPERPNPPKPEEEVLEGGRGLLLVAALALRWGVDDRKGPGKAVWAEYAVQREVVRGRGPETRPDRALNGPLE